MAVGRVVLVAGVLVLLFIPYLLWGTGLYTAHAQAQLRQEFAAAERRAGMPVHRIPTAPPGTQPAPPTIAAATPDPAAGSPVGVISIPTIGLSMVVVEGTEEAQLQGGPGHYPATPLPGEAGNVAIAGHRTTYLHPFYNLNELVPGNTIDIATVQGLFVYRVTSSQVVDPTDVAVVDPTPTPTLTLTTCNPRYSAAQRLVVHAASRGRRAHPRQTGSTDLVDFPHPTDVTDRDRDPPDRTGRAARGTRPRPSSGASRWLRSSRGSGSSPAGRRGSRRAAVLTGGLLAWLGVVFLFFQALSPLPAYAVLIGPIRGSSAGSGGPERRKPASGSRSGDGAATAHDQQPTGCHRARHRLLRARRCPHR